MPAADGASVKPSTVATSMPAAKIAARSEARSAKIRAFFVHPDWARQGIGSLILEACEEPPAKRVSRSGDGRDIERRGIYRAKGYAEVENQEVPLSNGETLPIVRMAKK